MPPLTVLFQPIVEISRDSYRIYGMEGLIRGPAGSSLESAIALFEQARRDGTEAETDRACIVAILRAAVDLPTTIRISINVNIETLVSDCHLLQLLLAETEACQIDASRLILEIVEYTPELVSDSLLERLEDIREIGAEIAVDDLGSGRSNYRKVLDCGPEFIKIDRYFAQSCDRDFRREAVFESVVLLASRLGSRVIAEGIERAEELEVATRAGIDLIQGFLFARPAPVGDLLGSQLLEGVALPLPKGGSAPTSELGADCEANSAPRSTPRRIEG